MHCFQLKICVTLVITASLEVEHGIINLWTTVASGFKLPPDYGQFIPQAYFNAFVCGFPHLWSPKHLWFSDHVPWDCFLPFVEAFNQKRRDLLKTVYLLMDESMSAWRPKTTKTGGLPNITFEPRKPKPLGTMLKNGVEATTGIMVTQDIVEGADAQRVKKYNGDVSSLPRKEPIMGHVAETLRLCNSANVAEGGWVGGDAWFGSIPCVVELMKKKGIFLTFIIKQNVQYCPLQVIQRIMRARNKDGRAAGRHAVMKATISGVDLFLLAYAWSNQRAAYIVSSCGTTVQHEKPYRTHFTDDYGNVTFKEIPRPSIAHFYFELCPLIDNHNKDRQGILGLEDCWPTKNPWFRLVTTMIGMSVIDLHRWDRNKRSNGTAFEWLGDDDERPEFLKVRSMANLIGRGLRKPSMIYYNEEHPRQPSKIRQVNRNQQQELTRITNKEGEICQHANGKKGGKGYVRSCLICRQYQEKAQNTNWWCSACRVPLCRKNRGREPSCYDEHISRMDDPVVGCFARDSEHVVVPQTYKLYKPENMVPKLPPIPAWNNVQTMETNTTEVAVGRCAEDIIGRTSSDSDSDSDCGEALLAAAAATTTKKRSAPSKLLPPVRKVSTRLQAVGNIRRSERTRIRM